MKKLLVSVTAIAMLTMSLVAVSASEPAEENVTSNMDTTTYLELRVQQLDDALEIGDIDQEQYDALFTHISDNATNGIFGRGPRGNESADSEDCVLGEDGNLGIFRNSNSGTRSGQGFGMANRSADGTGYGSQGTGSGNSGTKGNSGTNGMRLQDGSANNEDCILN